MSNINFLKQIAPFIPDNVLEPRIEQTIRIPLMPGVKWEDLPKVQAPQVPGLPIVKKGFTVTSGGLMRLSSHINQDKAEKLAIAFNMALPRYGMDNKFIFPDYLCQVCHESNYFKAKSENLNYSASRLREIFPKYFPNNAIAAEYAWKPEAIANRVYANRMGNGPESSGDGWRNRGGGYMQLTGDFIYQLYLLYIQKHIDATMTIDDLRNKVRTTEEFAIDSSLWYFAVYASLKDEAERDALREITKSINGGYIGLEDRQRLFSKALSIFAI